MEANNKLDFSAVTSLNYDAHQKNICHRLIIGPWTHIPWGRYAGGVDHGPEADGNIHLKRVKWFDYWLKGKKDKSILLEPAIHYFELGSFKWQSTHASDLMEASSDSEGWYLTSSNKPANGSLGGGLSKIPLDTSEKDGAEIFVYDARLPMSLNGYQYNQRNLVQDRYEF
jgi:predicted acyl esterase